MVLEGKSDVLVVGAGPAGCAAGITLARAGVDVCVVDRARFPRDKTCGDSVSHNSLQLIEQIGALALVEAVPRATVKSGAVVFPDGSRVTRNYREPGYIVPRFHLDDCLRRALEQSGARLEQGRGAAQLIVRQGRVMGAEGPLLRWSAKIVIAADGYGSIGHAALGQAVPKGRHLGLCATAYYRGVGYPYGEATADHYFEHALPYGYGWIFPAVDGVANLGVYIRADAYAKAGANLGRLLSYFIERHADRLGDAEPIGKSRTWSLPIAPQPIRITGPGLLLAGDAGGFVDPFSGEGIWPSLYTGLSAGSVAAEALANRGELDLSERRRYERLCEEKIRRPCRVKAWVQSGMKLVVDCKLYRSSMVKSALSWGYRRRLLELVKSR